jgi:hypothetical protein
MYWEVRMDKIHFASAQADSAEAHIDHQAESGA